MWTGGARDWIILGLAYLFSLGCFRFLGGFGSAGEAFRRWGDASARRWVARREANRS
jgi:hypothetical protein